MRDKNGIPRLPGPFEGETTQERNRVIWCLSFGVYGEQPPVEWWLRRGFRPEVARRYGKGGE